MPPSRNKVTPNSDLSNCFDFHLMEDFANTVLETAIVTTLDGQNYDASSIPKLVSSMNKFIVENMSNGEG
jgi:hypothetical protein